MTYVHVNHRISRDALRAMVIETRTFFPCNKRDIEWPLFVLKLSL